MLRIQAYVTEHDRLENSLITISDLNNSYKSVLGNLSYIMNRTNLTSLSHPLPKHDELYIITHVFEPINILFTNTDIYTEEQNKSYIVYLNKIKDLKYKPYDEMRKELSVHINSMYITLNEIFSNDLLSKLGKDNINKISVMYHCGYKSLMEYLNINKEDYLNLINLSLYLKYTLPIISYFPSLSNIELYTEIYIHVIQKYFNDIYIKVISLIKQRIYQTFSTQECNDIYKYYGTIIETDIFMSLVMYHNVLDINEDNNLLNLITNRIDILLLNIKHKYITNFIEE